MAAIVKAIPNRKSFRVAARKVAYQAKAESLAEADRNAEIQRQASTEKACRILAVSPVSKDQQAKGR